MAAGLEQHETPTGNRLGSSSAQPLRSLEVVLGELWSDWIFRLSLSSNELFHSNILQFLVEELSGASTGHDYAGEADKRSLDDVPAPTMQSSVGPQAISWTAAVQLYSVLSGSDEAGLLEALPDTLKVHACESLFWVRREWQGMDLVVGVNDTARGDRPLFALEVKVKSYPTREQLLQYQGKLGKAWKTGCNNEPTFQPTLFLLTGMGADRAPTAPVPAPNVKAQHHAPGRCCHVSFKEMGDRFQKLFERGDPPHFVGMAYAALCQKIHRLFGSLESLLQDTLTTSDTGDVSLILAPYRLHALWWKLWGAHIARELERQVPLPDECKKYFIIEHGFSHTGSFNAYWSFKAGKKKSEEALGIGVQLEGRSLRLFLSLSHPSMSSSPRGLDARAQAENLLLALCARRGLFIRNPGMERYRRHWETSDGQFINRRPRLSLGNPFPAQAVFVKDEVGIGRSAEEGGKLFCLPGYKNSQSSGHADFRLLLRPDVTLAALIVLIKEILFDGRYSGFSDLGRNGCQGPNTFLEVIKEFEAAGKERQDWIKRQTQDTR